ncbi:MAG: aspartate kinase, partial [Anaeroplasmataceae bacterium]|nr:aspartate kinase [Anaeroplasmataceae bacterium]
MLVVTKFGGSSLSCATQFAKVKNIVLADAKRKIVVVSALGKRDSSDTKITDLLYILHAHLKYGVPYMDIWNMISSRLVEIEEELELNSNIMSDLEALKQELNKSISEDYLVSRGEYLTAKLMSSYLGYPFVDAKDLIAFSYDGKVDYPTTEKKVRIAFSEHGTIVVPGFYGAYPNGSVRLFSRGGSDVTGSILAKCLNVGLYENWTDVPGILAADPRIIDKPKAIKEITYAELRELSYMGANVLHEETVFPVQSLNIPINLKNTNDPLNPGTLIKNN